MLSHIIIAHLYQPSSAATNRIIAYAKSFVELHKKVTLVLGWSEDKPMLVLKGVKVIDVTAPFHFLIVRNMANMAREHYTNDSAILVYGSPVLCWYLPKSKYKIFYECTEVPFYGRKKTIISRVKEGIKEFLSKRATGMFVISCALKSYFEAKGIKNITIVNMFVDAGRFKNSEQARREEKYIGYCGTISPFKDGVDVLLKAFTHFHKTHQDYYLKMIGRFESKNAEQYLKKLVKDLGITDLVQFTGMVMSEDMPCLLCEAQMLALARPDNDQARYGFPTKLGEYLATGKPVVVTNVGEIGLFLKDMDNCRMAQPGDEKDFSDKMSWVADNYQNALLLAKKGRKLTETAFSCSEQCKKAISFMENHMK